MENPVVLPLIKILPCAVVQNGSTRFSIFHIRFFICHFLNASPKQPLMTADTQARADDLEQRLIDFAVRIINLSALPRTAAGKHIASQILRSGTSPAPNYGEARGGESRADFLHKLGIVLKELNETLIWLRMIEGSCLVPSSLLLDILKENAELCRIFTSSLKTARSRR